MNISSIKTPGVYINEIDAFPPSIAQVATAIPAFVGYTEKGPSEPVKIKSLLQFQSIFGGAPQPKDINIVVNDDIYEVTQSKFKLYNSLRLFFANGGGECYIVSVGKYIESKIQNDINKGELIDGLKSLRKYDEPTLLLFPDAIDLVDTDLKDLQTAALKQCADLMDRFAIIDVKEVDTANPKSKLDESSETFRSGIGTQNLKYGAAYYPYLQANFPNQFRFSDVHKALNFKTIYATEQTIVDGVTNFELLHKESKTLIDLWNAVEEDEKYTIPRSKIELIVFDEDDDTEVDEAKTITKIETYYNQIWAYLEVLKDNSNITHGADPSQDGLHDFLKDQIEFSLMPIAQNLIDFQKADPSSLLTLDIPIDYTTTNWGWNDFSKTTTPNPYSDIIDTDPQFNIIQSHLDKINTDAINAMNSVFAAIDSYVLNEENNLISQIPIYSNIISNLNKSMNLVPPSGAIAGIYAQTDATRGVWKAPANVSVSGITGLNDAINDKDQEEMNIHSTGKSINAIRTFTGKGHLVWGARTLAGNSNDWRYISVRRLANMIEESSKKACQNFVFEPNVKQTWVSVKGMIENYLTTLWRDGALAGAKPEHAFFVSVGLDETMSIEDINDGRMLVTVGYAPSRPAEFIVLTFTQTQQKS